jgi:hypothetical protein
MVLQLLFPVHLIHTVILRTNGWTVTINLIHAMSIKTMVLVLLSYGILKTNYIDELLN